MGVGMILVVPLENHRAVESELKRRREKYYRIGQIRRGDPRKPQVVFTGPWSLQDGLPRVSECNRHLRGL